MDIPSDFDDLSEDESIDSDETNPLIIDTTDPTEVRTYIHKINKLPINCSSDFITGLESLPKTVSMTGRTNSTIRIIKILKDLKLLPKNFQSNVLKFNIEEKACFEEALRTATSNDVHLRMLKSALLLPFNKLVRGRNPVSSGNAHANKTALFAWLLVAPEAEQFWRQLDTEDPTDTDGISGWRTVIGEQLISIANAIKDDIGSCIFSEECVGSEAALALANIHPHLTSFTSAKELFELRTRYRNLHDTLIQRLDSSGPAEPEGLVARRVRCFDHFIGSRGRSKNIPLFYCFIVWESKSTYFGSRRLEMSASCSSMGLRPVSPVRSEVESCDDDETFTEEDVEEILAVKRLLSSSPQYNESEYAQRQMQLLSTQIDYAMSKKRLYDEEVKALKTRRLQIAMSSEAVLLLSEDERERLRRAWIDSLKE